MKKIIAILMTLCLFVGLCACSSSSTTNTTEPEATLSPVEQAKEKLAEAYNTCCNGSDKTYAKLGSDKMSLTIDTKPKDTYYSGQSDANAAIIALNDFLGLPSSLLEKFQSTRPIDGTKSQDCGVYTVTWNFSPDNGLKIIYEVNP
mgnify:CR=1 FL=1